MTLAKYTTELSDKYNKLPPQRQAQTMLVSAVTTYLSICLALNKAPWVQQLFDSLNRPDVMTWFGVIAIAAVSLAHIFASMLETKWASSFYPKLMPGPPINMLIGACSYGALLPIMASISYAPKLFVSIYAAYAVIDVFLMRMLSLKISDAISNARRRKLFLNEVRLDEVHLYYVRRPWWKLGLFR